MLPDGDVLRRRELHRGEEGQGVGSWVGVSVIGRGVEDPHFRVPADPIQADEVLRLLKADIFCSDLNALLPDLDVGCDVHSVHRTPIETDPVGPGEDGSQAFQSVTVGHMQRVRGGDVEIPALQLEDQSHCHGEIDIFKTSL